MDKIAFFLGVYKDQDRAKNTIQSLRFFYPLASIISIADGVKNADYSQFCFEHGINYWVGERFKLMQFGGAWTARFLAAMLYQTNADVLIKIDPDSGIHSPLDVSGFPDADLFGNIRTTGGRAHIQGGFIAFRRTAAEALLNSKLLGSAKYCCHSYSYPRFQLPYLQEGEESSSEWLTCEDVILYDAAHELGLTIADFDQVCCHYRSCPLDAPSRYAITHPYPYFAD